MRSSHSPLQRLRQAIDCLPVRTRRAMLEGIDRFDIVVGAYTTRDGGLCPMLAAHRCGGRANLLSFAHAWDRYTTAGRRVRRGRRATERELRILRFELEASLLGEEDVDLSRAIAEHRAVRERPATERPAGKRRATERPGDPHRAAELRGRWGWAWMRPLRRLDDYERALRRLQEEAAETAAREQEPAPGPAVAV